MCYNYPVVESTYKDQAMQEKRNGILRQNIEQTLSLPWYGIQSVVIQTYLHRPSIRNFLGCNRIGILKFGVLSKSIMPVFTSNIFRPNHQDVHLSVEIYIILYPLLIMTHTTRWNRKFYFVWCSFQVRKLISANYIPEIIWYTRF